MIGRTESSKALGASAGASISSAGHGGSHGLPKSLLASSPASTQAQGNSSHPRSRLRGRTAAPGSKGNIERVAALADVDDRMSDFMEECLRISKRKKHENETFDLGYESSELESESSSSEWVDEEDDMDPLSVEASDVLGRAFAGMPDLMFSVEARGTAKQLSHALTSRAIREGLVRALHGRRPSVNACKAG
eukprot:CAMPEP_0175078658 /NCGR_PEP_ID=MMETSP0052_2-20121109/24280_1 /TAXON_ID=51329 ORGANISM="Polytomella parva, Strain SAG 63-3" /NCGR_SAMPLE_ID=MMETSP0052_2 /ASSEMBLY_ACC=CAM_ASM_000194 /LENGTH=191 /DNA_ID=CAMNT_0016348683 /DNA_START=51 /DNA_END=623 /DNA_ORIENTATION=+